ncbi:PLAT domain-containing protein 2-like [Mercurialis annua]|uniref:PLAT domain-containing protein 2-like n=1 Tax=Mercurialis annua TaxID=3986 RepID=UPI00215DFB0C|nr:PLAT domain-containing protein 2-like [Mercurialis annua]
MAASFYILSVLLFFTLYDVVVSQTCVYSIAIKTGDKRHAGTDSTIGLQLWNGRDSPMNFPNIKDYGIARPGHDYFEQGNLDRFVYSGRCFSSPVCFIKLTSDNGGNKPGWYAGHVELITTGGSSGYQSKFFSVNQWLATSEPPYQLSVSRDLCQLREKNVVIESVVDGVTM